MTTKSPKSPDKPAVESFAFGPDGTRLYVRHKPAPSQTTAILCDGLVCDGFIYKYLWEDLGADLPVSHWHYRGHGRSASPVDPARVDVEAHADDLDAVRRHLGDPPVVLVGHSFGTQVALEAYRRRPDKIHGLILLCGSFGQVTRTFHGSDLLESVLPNLMAFAERRPALARALWSRVPPKLALQVALLTGEIDRHSIQVADMEPYFKHVAHVDFWLFLQMLRHAGQHSAQDMLAEVKVPTLVVAGERDSFTPPALSRAMAEAIPSAEFLLIPGATHVAPLEHRLLMRQRIHEFLSNNALLG